MGSSLGQRHLPWVAVGLCCVLSGCAPAAAATIGINDTILTAFTTPGDDVLVLFSSPTEIVFAGVEFEIVTAGCTGVGSVSCTLSGLTELRINLLEGDDVLEMSALGLIPSLTFVLLGGPGDDVMIGGSNSENMFGGAGDDVLIGGGGTNCLSGGAGDNILIDSHCDPGPEPDFPPAEPTPVPEPTALLLLWSSLGMLALVNSRRRLRP